MIGRPLPGQRGDFGILGVMPPSFAYPVGAIRPTEVWIPNVFGADERVRADGSPTVCRSSAGFATARRSSRLRRR